MHFTRSMMPIKTQYTLRENRLETVSQAAYLGVELDNRLTWTPHKKSHCKVNKNTTLCKKEC